MTPELQSIISIGGPFLSTILVAYFLARYAFSYISKRDEDATRLVDRVETISNANLVAMQRIVDELKVSMAESVNKLNQTVVDIQAENRETRTMAFGLLRDTLTTMGSFSTKLDTLSNTFEQFRGYVLARLTPPSVAPSTAAPAPAP